MKAAVPSQKTATKIVFQHQYLVLIAMGIDPLHDGRLGDYEPLARAAFSTPNDYGSGLLEVGFAARAGIHVGDTGEISSR